MHYMSEVIYDNSNPFFLTTSKKGIVSWSSIFVSMAVSLFIVAGVSLSLNMLSAHISKKFVPSNDRLVNMGLAHFFSGTPVEAASIDNTDVSAMRLIQSTTELTLSKKGRSVIKVGFKNTGNKPWPANSVGFRSAVTRGSYLSDASWKTPIIVSDSIQSAKPGELIYVKFTIEAPVTLGSYQDTFYLTYNGMRISGTDTIIKLNVGNAIVPDTQISSKPLPQVSTVSHVDVPHISPVVATQSGTFDAMPLIKSANSATLGQLQATDFQIGWKNTGTAVWKAGDAVPIRLRSSARYESYFRHSSWDDGAWVMTLQKDVNPGELVFTSFKIEAPSTVGNYTDTFSLYHGSTQIGSASIILPMTVIAGATPRVQIAQQPAIDNALTSTQPVIMPMSTGTPVIDAITEVEPLIRVGLFNTHDIVRVTANKAFEARDGGGSVLATISAGSVASVSFDFIQKTYSLTIDSATIPSASLIRFVGVGSAIAGMPDQDTIFTILSYTDHPGWSSVLNDNQFRSAIEVRYAPTKDQLWVINELTLENYLKGLGETSNNSPYEFQKALVTAARTYAKIVSSTTKYSAENFNVRNTDADQVYRGYNGETRMPQLTRAINETRGVVVTYNGKTVITPYYSNSDGRTRAWEEVWGGSPKPWLVSVADPNCAGLTLWGHGVGMSARGAVGMAVAGSTYDQILTHYYTAVQLMRLY